MDTSITAIDDYCSLFQGEVWDSEQSLSCLGVTDAKYNSIFDKGVLKYTEFTCLTQPSQHSNILINGFATFFGSRKELIPLVTDVFPRFTVFHEFV